MPTGRMAWRFAILALRVKPAISSTGTILYDMTSTLFETLFVGGH